MIPIDEFISGFYEVFGDQKNLYPWEITKNLNRIIEALIPKLHQDFDINHGIAIHKTAKIEMGAVLKAPIIISEKCFVSATSYLRGGVFLGNSSIVGPSSEVKTSIVFHQSVIAHLNFVGDSIIGSDVNFEAGSHTANHYNERVWKNIDAVYRGELVQSNCNRFGSVIGDHSRIGANAVLAPGTLLNPSGIVERLTFFDPSSALRRS